MRTKDCIEWHVAVVSVLGMVEESCLVPCTTADVGLRWQLADEPLIGCVDGYGISVDRLALRQPFRSVAG